VRQKGFGLLPVIIIIALIGVVGYLIYQNTQLRNLGVNPSPALTNSATNLPETSPTSDPTANWKTYTNDKLLVSLRYPTESGLQVFTYSTNDFDIAINKGQYDSLFFELVRLPNLDLQDWYHKAYTSTKQDRAQPPELQSGPQIGGLNSYKADFNLEGAGKVIFIFVQKNKDLYEIHVPISGNEIQYQILSTFKFTQ
jgi:hypothetical protein